MSIIRLVFCLLTAYQLVGCSSSEPSAIVLNSDDYSQLSYEKLGKLLNSSTLLIRIVDRIEEKPDMQQHLMRFFEIKTYNDLTLINRINEIYTVKKLNAYHRYEIEFNSTNEDVRILLEKTFLEVIEAYHQELMPIQRTEKGVQRLKGRQADGVRVSR